jgi:hypothetical protein
MSDFNHFMGAVYMLGEWVCICLFLLATHFTLSIIRKEYQKEKDE